MENFPKITNRTIYIKAVVIWLVLAALAYGTASTRQADTLSRDTGQYTDFKCDCVNEDEGDS